jgi:aryl-alcohol dehydrogenase-like predicted oxidoreductase
LSGKLIPMARALNLGLTAWSPLSNGVLTGKYQGYVSSEPGRLSHDMLKEFMREQKRTDRVVAAVKTVSEQTGRSMAQIALAWLHNRSAPVIPIIGTRKRTQLQDNLASLELALSADQLKILDEASRIGLGFPHDLYTRELVHAVSYGGLRNRILT